MELLTPIIGLAMPFAVLFVTNFAKKLSTFSLSSNRIVMVRGLVALLSLVGALLTQLIGGETLDPGVAETLILTIWNGAIATFVYLKTKND